MNQIWNWMQYSNMPDFGFGMCESLLLNPLRFLMELNIGPQSQGPLAARGLHSK